MKHKIEQKNVTRNKKIVANGKSIKDDCALRFVLDYISSVNLLCHRKHKLSRNWKIIP